MSLLISSSKEIRPIVLSTIQVSLTPEPLTPVTLLSKVGYKVRIPTELVVLPTALVFLMLEASNLISLPFEFETQAIDYDAKAETENSMETKAGNVGSSIVETNVTIGFKEKFSTMVVNVEFKKKSRTGAGNIGLR